MRIAITGGIGSGKSHVCRMLEERGIEVFDCDTVAKRIIATDVSVRRALMALINGEKTDENGSRFNESEGNFNEGKGNFNESEGNFSESEGNRDADGGKTDHVGEGAQRLPLTKETLGQYLRANKENAARVNAIVHPRVAEAFRESGLEWMECAILFESGFDRLVDAVAVVTCPEEERIRRIVARDHCDRATALRWIALQMSDAERLKRASALAIPPFIVVNDGLMPLEPQLDAIFKRLMTEFQYTDESFADIQLLRYKVEGFESLSLQQKTLIYHLTEAALCGRDILYDQNGQFNLRLRQMLETVYQALEEKSAEESGTISEENDFYAVEIGTSGEQRTTGAEKLATYAESNGGYAEKRGTGAESNGAGAEGSGVGAEVIDNASAFRTYMKRFWFSHGLHHHYGCEKFVPGFSEEWLREQLTSLRYPIDETLLRVIFDPSIAACRCNQRDGDDLLLTSASNYYQDGITQAEAEAFYAAQRTAADEGDTPVQYGLNSRLCRAADGSLYEDVASTEGLYAPAIRAVVGHLEKARLFAENEFQLAAIDRLIEFYRTGDLRTFDDYCIAWLRDTESRIDFVNGFTETYGDPLGLKASWESIVNFKDLVATQRTETLARNAQWFEDHSPVDARFKKPECKGISAKVITAAIISGDLYPATAIGINLPNSDWVRRDHGSKSVTIGNFTDAYNRASRGSGMLEEFCIDEATREVIRKYGDVCDDLHTDLHECLGHGSGQLLPGVASDALGVYGSTIEEARADLFALYYLADPCLVQLGLTPNGDAYKSNYYTYLQNGLLTQLIRIEPGHVIEEAHMRNRAIIARWVVAQASAAAAATPGGAAEKEPAAELITRNGKTFVRINDYAALRTLFGRLLAEVQRIKSEGDFEGARRLVEDYGVQIDAALHREILDRYARLGLRPYKGFINPVYVPLRNADDEITDVIITYGEAFDKQNLRYSQTYSYL